MNFSRRVLCHRKTTVCLKYFGQNCSGSCNNVNDLFAKICVPGIVKDLNVKVFNQMSGTNETRHIKWHEMCKSKCILDVSVCNNKQRWNDDKC